MTLMPAPMASRLSRRPSRRKQKKRSQNCGANIRALVPSTGKREGRKFGRHWRLSKRFLLVLLRYKLLRARFRAVPPQHGHRGNRLTIAAMSLRRNGGDRVWDVPFRPQGGILG